MTRAEQRQPHAAAHKLAHACPCSLPTNPDVPFTLSGCTGTRSHLSQGPRSKSRPGGRVAWSRCWDVQQQLCATAVAQVIGGVSYV